MRIRITLDTDSEALNIDPADELAAIVERVVELVAEHRDHGDTISAELFDSDSKRVGDLTIWRR